MKQVKKTEDNQESDAEAPDFTSETNLDISSKKNIPQLAKKSNASTQKNQDRDYLSAVERGDMETAQRMVDEAAQAAGYDLHLYHGSKSGGGFTMFKDWQYFTANQAYAERYTQMESE